MPAVLEGVSITNSLTFASRIRVTIMKEMAKRHSEANPGLQCFVTNYLPRPTLKLRDKGTIKSFTYVDAVKRFGHHLSNTFLGAQTRFAKTNMPVDKLLPTFLVLSPDLLSQGSNSLDLSLVSNGGVQDTDDQAMADQTVYFSPPTDLNPESSSQTNTSKKGEKRKANQTATSSKKAATNYFG